MDPIAPIPPPPALPPQPEHLVFVVEYPPLHEWGRATHPDAVAVVDQAVELLAFFDEVEQEAEVECRARFTNYEVENVGASDTNYYDYVQNQLTAAEQEANDAALVVSETRTLTSTSSHPVLVNTDEEVSRWAATLDLYVRAYPLLNQHRREASVWALMGHLFRLLTWYVFFNRISAEAEIDQLTHRFSFAKKAKKQTESECASGK